MRRKGRIIGKDIPLLFACSGASKPGELADLTARALAETLVIVMSCPAAITAGFEDFTRKLKGDRKVIALDGCRKSCIARSLCCAGYDGFLHIRLDKLGLKGDALEANEKTVEKAVVKVSGVLKARSVWGKHRFHHLMDLKKLK